MIQSDDDGLTWSAPRDISRMVRPADTVAVASPGIGIQLERGPHQGRLIYSFYVTLPDGHWENAVAYSDDLGETWTQSSRVPHTGLRGFGNECQVAELSDGAVLLSSRNQGGEPCRKSAISRDGGATWEPMRLDRDLVSPACMGSLIRQGWQENGKSLLLATLPNDLKARKNGSVYLSQDEGQTWPVRRTLYPGGFAYSCLVMLPDGTVGCIFERDDCKYISFLTFEMDWVKQ